MGTEMELCDDQLQCSEESVYVSALSNSIPERSSSMMQYEFFQVVESFSGDEARTGSQWSTIPACENTHEVIEPPNGWGRLLSVNEHFSLKHKELTEASYEMGRQADCQIQLCECDFPSNFYRQISKKQCSIIRTKEGLTYIKDLSSNGTFVNSRKVGKNKSLILSNNAEIGIAGPARSNIIFMYIETTINREDDHWLPPELEQRLYPIKHLGSGGFAEVRLFIERTMVDGTNKHLAVKKIEKSGIETANPLNEIEILRKLCHPCIVELDGWYESSKYAYVFMEYLPDGNLNQILDRKQLMDEQLCKFIIFQVATAVNYIHQQNVTHRDIKPENILTRKVNDLMIVKLADFGLSKILKSTTQLRTNCGTYLYAAPEVINRNEAYTYKVDMWAVGIILYYCLCGEHPASGANEKKFYEKGEFNTKIAEWVQMPDRPKHLIERTIVVNPEVRIDSSTFLKSGWFMDAELDAKIELLFGSALRRPDYQSYSDLDLESVHFPSLLNIID